VLAVSTLGWILRVVGAVVVALLAYVLIASTISKFKIAPPAEPDPDSVVPMDQRFRCTVCGAEVTMTAAQEGEEVEPPRHCREDMVPV
jgi:hypothetical protein